ncbi:hypothetical protein [Thermopetrobacter sp. TC1]|uniref:hypothetical protein n=1 Tax=Thermopetrobacter sp. TC1 TaxID=1495045 RepID=UPI0012DFFFA7|nr:hypothetical protein [Thermopetrobacter sp. TC1]
MVCHKLLMRRFTRRLLRLLRKSAAGVIRKMRRLMHGIKGWRTLMFSLLVASLGVFEATDWTNLVPDGPHKGYWLLAIALIIAWLRTITTTPVGQR